MVSSSCVKTFCWGTNIRSVQKLCRKTWMSTNKNSNYIEDTVCKKVSLLFLPMAMSAVSTVRTIAQSLGKGSAQPQGGAELHPQALVHNSDVRGDGGGGDDS